MPRACSARTCAVLHCARHAHVARWGVQETRRVVEKRNKRTFLCSSSAAAMTCAEAGAMGDGGGRQKKRGSGGRRDESVSANGRVPTDWQASRTWLAGRPRR